jgi:hypothetical protein
MVGPTLIEIREHIERLATQDGQYCVVCGRTGERPVPAAGHRFPDRPTARAAARATEQYRSALRRYDPRVPYYDLIVCEGPGRDPTGECGRHSGAEGPEYRLSDPVVTGSATPEHRDLVEFCHRVAGAVFETLSGAGYKDVEMAVMDAYFDLAETVDDPDELCLCLLEGMARELGERLSAAEQAEVLTGAAARLEPPDGDGGPFEATLATLGRQGVVESYTRPPQPADPADSEFVAVQVSGYALSSRDGRLPVLPLTLELCRHRPERPPQSVRATPVNGGWRLTFVLAEAAERTGLVSAPVDGKA